MVQAAVMIRLRIKGGYAESRLRRSFCSFITVMTAQHTAVIVLVMISGQLPISAPCTTKNTLPTPIDRNVGSAMPSVLRVRIVYMACGM